MGKRGQAVILLIAAMLAVSLWVSREQETAVVFGEMIVEPTDERTFRVEVIRTTPAPRLAKRILIYHSHTWEAYTQVEDAPYVPTEKWRTRDASANVTAVGRALASALTALGYTVVHDDTAFEPPDLSSSYKRSLDMLTDRQERGEMYDLYIDLHRDAFADANAIKRTVSIGGEDVARFMVLIGKGTGLTGEGYAIKPDWQKNLAIAQKITDAMNDQCDQLCREVKIKTGRFNQHVAPCCVLIECGSNHNTLAEVLRGVPYLAEAIHQSMQ